MAKKIIEITQEFKDKVSSFIEEVKTLLDVPVFTKRSYDFDYNQGYTIFFPIQLGEKYSVTFAYTMDFADECSDFAIDDWKNCAVLPPLLSRIIEYRNHGSFDLVKDMKKIAAEFPDVEKMNGIFSNILSMRTKFVGEEAQDEYDEDYFETQFAEFLYDFFSGCKAE